MNTILVTGTSYIPETRTTSHQDEKFCYDVQIFGHQSGEALQFITSKVIVASCYGDMWQQAKEIAVKYFNNDILLDGAYTQFMDHINLVYSK
jgi:hypothetical protein